MSLLSVLGQRRDNLQISAQDIELEIAAMLQLAPSDDGEMLLGQLYDQRAKIDYSLEQAKRMLARAQAN